MIRLAFTIVSAVSLLLLVAAGVRSHFVLDQRTIADPQTGGAVMQMSRAEIL